MLDPMLPPGGPSLPGRAHLNKTTCVISHWISQYESARVRRGVGFRRRTRPGRAGSMALSFDLYWSFRSPYSYLATDRIVRLHARYDVEVRVKPVLPLAVRTPDFFDRVNPLWPPYLLRDTYRIAQHLGVDYGW